MNDLAILEILIYIGLIIAIILYFKKNVLNKYPAKLTINFYLISIFSFAMILILNVETSKMLFYLTMAVIANMILITLYLVNRNQLEQVLTTNHNCKEIVVKPNKKYSVKHSHSNLSNEQLIKIYSFFKQHGFISDDLLLEEFKEKFLKEPIRLNCQNVELRDFFDHLIKSRNIKKLTQKDFLKYFIDSKTNNSYVLGTFRNNRDTPSLKSDELDKLFRDFDD